MDVQFKEDTCSPQFHMVENWHPSKCAIFKCYECEDTQHLQV